MRTVFQHIITIPVAASGAVKNISSFLPGNARKCIGVVFSPSEEPVTEGVQPFYRKKLMGNISLSFNNRATNPINYPVLGQTFGRMSQKGLKPLTLPIDLKPSSNINGYYVDKGNAADYPYNLRIYIFYKE